MEKRNSNFLGVTHYTAQADKGAPPEPLINCAVVICGPKGLEIKVRDPNRAPSFG